MNNNNQALQNQVVGHEVAFGDSSYLQTLRIFSGEYAGTVYQRGRVFMAEVSIAWLFVWCSL